MISLVIPVHNEDQSVPYLWNAIQTAMSSLGERYEAIFVNDGSTDQSARVLKEIQKSPLAKVVTLRTNQGKSAALKIGFAQARGKIVVTLDADLQDDPQDIPRLLERLKEGYDLVSGWKEERKDKLFTVLSSRILNLFASLLVGCRFHDINSGLKAYRREILKDLPLYGNLYRFVPIIAYLKKFSVLEVPVQHHPRKFGSSKYSWTKGWGAFFDLLSIFFLLRFFQRPLHVFGNIGSILFFVGLAVNSYLFFIWRQGEAVGGRPLLILGVLLIILAIQFISIGLLGELIVFLHHSEKDGRS